MPRWQCAFVVSAISLLAGCELGSGTAPGEAHVQLRHPPDRPDDATPAGGEPSAIFAFDTITFPRSYGHTWAAIGFDLDGVATTTRDAPGPCRLATGASTLTQVDGNGGIDNSFGQDVMPILESTFGEDIDVKLNASIASGEATNLLEIDHLVLGRDAWPLQAQLYVGAPLGAAPTWSTADVWPTDRQRFDSRGAARLFFAGSYTTSGAFVAAPSSGQAFLSIGNASGMRLVAPITRVQLKADLSPDGSRMMNGVLGAIMPVEDLVAEVRRLLEERSATFCSSTVRESIEIEFAQAADILVDGTVDPSRPCDGVSVGLGFTARRVSRGPAVDVPEPPSQCASP